MFRVFISPREYFAGLRERPAWLVPLLLTLLPPPLLAALTLTAMPRQRLISQAETRTQQAQEFVETRFQQAGNLSDEKKAEALRQMQERTDKEMGFLRTAGPVKFFAHTLLRSLPGIIWSALLLLSWTAVLNFLVPVMGAASGFARCLTVTANAGLVRPLGSLLRGLAMLLSGNLLLRTNLLPLIPPRASPFLRGFGASVDIFTLWEIALVAVGLGVVFNINPKKTAAAAFGLWLVYALLLGGVMSALGFTAFL
ncbi:MAG: YIP1 family protein [candidate division WOR-3 bacterium]